MKLVLTTLALLAGASADAQISRNRLVAEHCRTGPRLAAKSGAPLAATPLGKEPDAARIAAVWRRDHRGCPMPIVLDDTIGAKRR